MTEKSENFIVEKIGEAARWEQLAEECAELGHAALKVARILRGENPAPVNLLIDRKVGTTPPKKTILRVEDSDAEKVAKELREVRKTLNEIREQFGVTAAPKSDDGKPKRLPAATPDYYDFGTYEPIKIINHFNLNFNLGSVIKYVIRAGKKPDNPAVRDLHKAIDFLEFEIRRLEDRRNEDL